MKLFFPLLLLIAVVLGLTLPSPAKAAYPFMVLAKEYQVGGWIKSVVTEGSYLYVSRTDGITVVYNVNAPDTPQAIAIIPDSSAYAAKANYLYTKRISGNEWQIWEIHANRNPVLRGTFTPSGQFQSADENYLYFGDLGTVFIYSLANPLRPTLVGTWKTNDPVEQRYGVARITTTNDKLIVSLFSTSCGNRVCVDVYAPLKILDIGDPANPLLLGEASYEAAERSSWAANGNYLYQVDSGYPEIHILSLEPPFEEINVPFGKDAQSVAANVMVHEQALYVTGWTDAIGVAITKIFDISTPTSLKEVNQLSDWLIGSVENNTLFAFTRYDSTNNRFVTIYDVASVHMPELLGEITHPTNGILFWAKTTLFIVSTTLQGRTYIHRVEDNVDGLPVYQGAFRLPYDYPDGAYQVVNEQYLYVTNDGVLDIYTLPTSETAPTLVRRMDLPECPPRICIIHITERSMIIDGEQSNNQGVLTIYSLSDPTFPKRVATVETRFRTAVASDGDMFYFVDDFSTNSDAYIHIVDLSDPTTPLLQGQIPIDFFVYRLIVAQGHLYYYDGLENEINVIDVRNPQAPVEVATVTPPFGSNNGNFWIAANRLYYGQADSTFSVVIYDVQVPSSPRQIFASERLASSLSYGMPTAKDERVYLVDGNYGLQTWQLVEAKHQFLPLLQKRID